MVSGVNYFLPERGRLNVTIEIVSEFKSERVMGTALSNNVLVNIERLFVNAVKNALIDFFYNLDMDTGQINLEEYRYITEDGVKKLDYNQLLRDLTFNWEIVNYEVIYSEQDKMFEFNDRWSNKRIGKRDKKTGKFINNYKREERELNELQEIVWEEYDYTLTEEDVL